MSRKFWLLGLVALGAVVLAACGATPTPQQVPVTVEVPVTVQVPMTIEVTPVGGVPFHAEWAASGHADTAAVAFTNWDDADPAEVPAACAKCHTSAGYLDFAADGKVDAAVKAAPSGTLMCATCHSPEASALTSVTFPSGKVVSNLGPEARCMTCHQGRESKVSVDKQITDTFKITDVDMVVAPIKDAEGKDVAFGFRNIHYYAAGATLYGAEAQSGYEYEDKLYDVKFRHVDGVDTCLGCHDQHTLKVKVETCAECHEGVTTVEDLQNARMMGSLEDYNGNGDVEEGIAMEIKGLQETLYGAIQAYATEVSGKGLVYDGTAYPYFFADADGDGAADEAEGNKVRYDAWTARLLKAAYNYQVSSKDPGAFAHNGKYIIQLLYDSIEDLNVKLAAPVDMSAMHRNDAGHFAGNTLPFRDWDDSATGVPYRCVKCHTAEGLPTFVKNGGTMVVDQSGTTLTAGVSNLPPSNGFKCSTCHNTAAFPELYALASVTFPSGKVVSFGGKDAEGAWVADDANLCIACHQGRESTTSVNVVLRGKEDDTVDSKISFKNMHYFAAGATLFGTDVKGMYEFAGQTYNAQFMHGGDIGGPIKCTECHDVHKLEVQVETCTECHKTVKTVEDLGTIRGPDSTADYDGDGDTTEGIKGEIEGMREALYAAIQAYATDTAGMGIVYDAGRNPYFFQDKDGDGKIDKDDKGSNIRYANYTPNLLRAAFNYQAATKDPGQFAHNGQYVMQVLYDSIQAVGGDVSKMTRPAAPAPAP